MKEEKTITEAAVEAFPTWKELSIKGILTRIIIRSFGIAVLIIIAAITVFVVCTVDKFFGITGIVLLIISLNYKRIINFFKNI